MINKNNKNEKLNIILLILQEKLHQLIIMILQKVIIS